MISWPQALILGALLGATEYLPVSSSGHLVIAEHLFGLREPALLFNIVLHVGTLAAVLIYYRADVAMILRETLQGVREIVSGTAPAEVLDRRPGFRLALLITVAVLAFLVPLLTVWVVQRSPLRTQQ